MLCPRTFTNKNNIYNMLCPHTYTNKNYIYNKTAIESTQQLEK